jgi:hypothetical protein
LQLHIDQARRVSPVLEEAAGWLVGGAGQQARVVRAQAGEERQEMGPGDHIDGIDLELAQPVDRGLQIAHGHRSVGRATPKPCAASATRRACPIVSRSRCIARTLPIGTDRYPSAAAF